MMSTPASAAPCTAPAWTDFQNSCDVALGTTAISSLSRAAAGLAVAEPDDCAATGRATHRQTNSAKQRRSMRIIRRRSAMARASNADE